MYYAYGARAYNIPVTRIGNNPFGVGGVHNIYRYGLFILYIMYTQAYYTASEVSVYKTFKKITSDRIVKRA